MIDQKSPKTITFIGSGQVTAVIAGLLILHNRGLPEEKRVKISILGKKGSSSLKAMKE